VRLETRSSNPLHGANPTLALVLKVLTVIFSDTIYLFSSHECVKPKIHRAEACGDGELSRVCYRDLRLD
jgi:hypothetical protein